MKKVFKAWAIKVVKESGNYFWVKDGSIMVWETRRGARVVLKALKIINKVTSNSRVERVTITVESVK